MERIKNIFSGQDEAKEAAAQRMTRFQAIIEADDFNEIEAARDWVRPEDLEPLIALYWQLESWPQKRALVDILQDQFHPDMAKMMLDFLRAPLEPGDEPTELAQAVALGFIDEKYDQFMNYYNDRERLARDVKEVLRKNGLKAESPPEPEKPKPKPTSVDPNKSPNQRLMDGAVLGELTAVTQALHDGANINVTIGGGDYDGCSALMMALMRKRFDVADTLIDQGADVNHKRPDEHTPDKARGQTPLWWAANHGHMASAQKLLAKGADVNTPDYHGSTPLTMAASSGHLEMVRFLVEAGADVHAQIYDGRKAFNLAVTNGHKRVAEYLLSVGNEPNESGSSGYSPLMIAAENNFYDLAKLLIQQGADVNAVHSGPGIYVALRGWTPLVFAVHGGYVRMTKLLIQSGADVNYVVPAGHKYHGESLPAQRVSEFATGKRAESILKLLWDAGAK
ncbi:MAG: ankyrin repeat domain-containing protein [Ardenticatenaceae bacterium]|nr:ankyrin repeat domain-containing protein [Ardenticatenaceae bacterium]MCB9445846.1 ankyrin repeat domain-containing protein [Ardenticatenaceae bacterium]